MLFRDSDILERVQRKAIKKNNGFFDISNFQSPTDLEVGSITINLVLLFISIGG